ncbi:MAG: VPLPA-CTERM sorting domain-containing protein [Gammaproteobacteria bacterium]
MKNKQTISAVAGAVMLLTSPLALADFANGPDPYAPGFGFATPDSADWGGWTRGDAGTLYAEWDDFGAANPVAPDVGSAGTPAASFGWNAGTFVTGTTGNLYNFGSLQVLTIAVDGSAGPLDGPVVVALQTETWGTPLEADDAGNAVAPVTLNGAQWDSKVVTFQDAAFASAFGTVLLEQVLFLWTLDAPAASYEFVLQGGPHMSFAQAAVDIAPVPLPGAAWLCAPVLAGLLARRHSAVRGASSS